MEGEDAEKDKYKTQRERGTTETEKKHKILHATNFHQFSIPFHSVRLKMEFILSPQSHNASNKMVKRMTHYVHIIYMACMQQSFAVRLRLLFANRTTREMCATGAAADKHT